MNIILLGPPGCGKGTQALMLVKKLNIPSISTGEALRKEIEKKTAIGLKAKSYAENGQLVPDEIVINIIKERILLDDCKKGFILDGFPRNLNQAIELESIFSKLEKKIDKVLNFEVSEENLVKRISGRFSCKNCGAVYNTFFKPLKKEGFCDNCNSTQFESRKDDNEETIKSRLIVYNQSTLPLIEFYKKKNMLVSINALNSAEIVFQDIVTSINNNNLI